MEIIEVPNSSFNQLRAEMAATGKNYKCTPVTDEKRNILGWDFYSIDDRVLRVGPTFHPWVPHQPQTWPHRFMTTRSKVELHKWNQRHPYEENVTLVELPIGTRVKIVMASRLGDVGITDDLEAETGYHARIDIGEINTLFENFGNEP